MTKPIHLCMWSSQPDLFIACDLSWTQPAWNQPTLPDGVHLTDDGRLYTFDESLMTCPECRATASDPEKRQRASNP